MRKPLIKNEGFTLIEATIAAGIFSVALLGMVTMMERQNAARGGLQTQIGLRQVLNIAINTWEANAGNFPPVAAGATGAAGTRPLMYVGCFQSNGVAAINSVSNSTFVAIDIGASPPAPPPSSLITGLCDCAGGTQNYSSGVEVHVIRTLYPPLSPTPNTVTFYAYLLPPLRSGATCPSSYYQVGQGLIRNWKAPNYVNSPVKMIEDYIDISTPP